MTRPEPPAATAAALDVREQEARRIARDLHDEAGQMLAAAHVALDELARRVPARDACFVERIRQALSGAEEGLRRIAHDLRPMALDDLGLRAALEQMGQQVVERSGIAVETAVEMDARLPENVETHLYRIAQEALTNAVRHGGAGRVDVRLELAGRALRLTVRDDGRGIPRGSHAGGLGLRSMRERARLLGGRLDIHANPGRGTTVTALVPLRVDRWPPFES